MAEQLDFNNIRNERDILPLLSLAGKMGRRSRSVVFDACLNYYLEQHPEIPKDLGEIYFRDFIREEFDVGTFSAPVPGVAFSCLPQAVARSREARKQLAEHERAKSAFMGHYQGLNLDRK